MRQTGPVTGSPVYPRLERRGPQTIRCAIPSSGKTGFTGATRLAAAAALFLGLMTSPVWAGPFEEANEKYRAGDFQAAAKGYQEMLKNGQGTAAVYYNLGNSLLRLNKKAPALLAYERALASDPRNADLRWNIGVVRSMLTDREQEGVSSYAALVRRWIGFISVDETARALAVLVLLLALAGWIHFAAGGRLAVLRSIQIGVAAAAVLVLLLFAFQLRQEDRRRAVVLDKEVTLRYGPAFTETKAFILHEGATVDVLDESGDWLYVSFGKNSGWLPKKTSEIV